MSLTPGIPQPVPVKSKEKPLCGMHGCDNPGTHAVYVTVYSNMHTRTLRADLKVCASCIVKVKPEMLLPAWTEIEVVFKRYTLGRPDINRTTLRFQVL